MPLAQQIAPHLRAGAIVTDVGGNREVVDELGRNPAAAKAALAATSLQLRRLVGQLSDLKLKDSVQRLAGYLVELTPERQGAVEVMLPTEKRVVADRLGMKPETLSRAPLTGQTSPWK